MSDQRETRAGRRWMFAALFVFIFFLLLWIWAAFLLNPASAGSLPFSVSLRSRLAADYSPDEFSGSQGVFRLSIFNEVFHDLGLSPEEAEERSKEIKVAMGSPVPTATARNFEGDDPFTATPTPQPTSTVTSTPTETPLPTSTYRPTKTPKPTKEPKVDTPGPVFSATPSDSISPAIADPGTIIPTIGALGACSQDVSVSGVNVTDPSLSSGISWVKLKYKVYDDSFSTIYAGYIYSSPLNLDSGGPTAGGWDAYYSLPSSTYTISIYPGFSTEPPYSGPGPFKIKLWVIAEDNAGNGVSHEYGYYTMPNSCDDPPTATPTSPPPTATSTPDCSTITINGFGTSGDRAYWTINNGSSTDITIDEIYLNWPPLDGELDYVELGPLGSEEEIWDGPGHLPPSVNITSGWTGESRVIPLGASMRLIFDFDLDPAAPSGYTLSVSFAENSCTPSVSN